MLYLHCGWPRTGTSSLQSACFTHRAELASAGVLYPERWTEGEHCHRGLNKVLNAALQSASDQAFDDLRRFLEDRAGKDVLLSIEDITYWLSSTEKRDALVRLLIVAGELMPTRCVWMLRRLDQALASFFLLRLRLGLCVPPPEEYFRRVRPEVWLFSGMLAVEEALAGASVYLKYEPDGAHNRQFVDLLGLPDGIGSVLWRGLDRRRLNRSLSHKQAVICFHRELFAARTGLDLQPSVLRSVISRGELAFDHDAPCELLTGEMTRDLCERALASAQRHGFGPYIEFFADDDLGDIPPVRLNPDVITDEDLARLRESIHAQARAT